MRFLAGLLAILLAIGCQSGVDETTTQEESKEVPSELPFTSISLEDLSAFREVGSNWSIAGDVFSDYTQEKQIMTEPGTGVLVNQNDDTNKDHLYTDWEHGDLELRLQFMVPKGSNSGIYFQGRYEIQIFDSWLKKEVNYGDVGGIYQRVDNSRPEGQRGFDGHAPRVNAAKAPGLWQDFYIVFRAPRFDAGGNKTENARFEKVFLNGVLLHENVELSGPTNSAYFDDEAATGPLVIQGDHGPVAFRNIAYKRFFDETELKLNDIRYQYYEIDESVPGLPDFDTLQVVKEGSTDSLVYSRLGGRDEHFAYQFTGQLEVPKTGDYIFSLFSDDGSQLFIDGEMLIDHDGKHAYVPKNALVDLTEGTHDFRLTYFNGSGDQGLALVYEGPEMRKQGLLSRVRVQKQSDRQILAVTPEEMPEMVRSFVMHGGEKLTHAISVGDPRGVHYSVDLRRGALLQFWRGEFADVRDMWYRRGQPQLLRPLAMAIPVHAGHLAAVLSSADAPYPTDQDDKLSMKAYDINDAGEPVFQYDIEGTTVSDHYRPGEDGQELVRTIRAETGSEQLYARLAAEDYIKPVGNGFYSVGGEYFIRLLEGSNEPVIRENGGQTEMLVPLTNDAKEVKYAMLW